MPELGLHVLDGIHADVGELALGDPIFDVIDEEVEHLGVIVIEVRQARQLPLDVAGPADAEPSGVKLSLRHVSRMVHDHVKHYLHAPGFT